MESIILRISFSFDMKSNKNEEETGESIGLEAAENKGVLFEIGLFLESREKVPNHGLVIENFSRAKIFQSERLGKCTQFGLYNSAY